MSTPPKTIYLQFFGTGDPKAPGEINHSDVTWSTDRVNANDFEYRLVAKRRKKRVKRVELPDPADNVRLPR